MGKGGYGPAAEDRWSTPRNPLLEAFGVTKKLRAERRHRVPVSARGVTRPALDDEVGKRRLRAKRAKASRRRNR